MGAPPWEAILRAVRADALDCLQTTFAVLADRAHGPGTHLALGARWGDEPRATLDDRLAEAGELLGLRAVARVPGLDGPELRRLASRKGSLYVVADAYRLSWVPYAGRRHMEHSFLLTASGERLTVVDAYHNDTVYGPARPRACVLSAAEVDAAVRDGALALELQAGSLPRLDAARVLAANAARLRTAAADIERRAAETRVRLADPDGLERFVLDVWLLGRGRRLHAAWLKRDGGDAAADGAMEQRAEEWQRLAARSYVALRRAGRGRPAGPALVDELLRLVRGDVALAEQLASQSGARAGPATVRAAVVGALAVALHVDGAAIGSSASLRDLPGFNSFRLVDVIETVETRLGVELPGDGIASDDLRDVDGLCRLFARAEPRGAEAPI